MFRIATLTVLGLLAAYATGFVSVVPRVAGVSGRKTMTQMVTAPVSPDVLKKAEVSFDDAVNKMKEDALGRLESVFSDASSKDKSESESVWAELAASAGEEEP